jgi:hypothetical protein
MQYNIKINLEETGGGVVGCIHVVWNRDHM